MDTSVNNYLIRGGMVVDGTGSAPIRADLRVQDGLIAAIAPALAAGSGEALVDAAGCYVTPGLIESHTPFDGTMWWQPDLNPAAV